MKRSLKLMYRVVLFLAVFIGGFVFSGQAFAESASNSNSPFEYIKGQLVVSIDAHSHLESMQRAGHTMLTSAQLERRGFQVVDSVLDSIQSAPTRTLRNDSKLDVADKMGLLYLIEYRESKYKNVEEAREELEITLKGLGLDVRYVHGHYTMYALEAAPELRSPTAI